MEAIANNPVAEVLEPKKSGRGQYERQKRGSYKNVEDKKITVQHYVNTKINLLKTNRLNQFGSKIKNLNEKTDFINPLYVKVSFNGQMNFFRSKTEIVISTNYSFENAMKDENLSRALEREIHLIGTFIKENSIQEDDVRQSISSYSFDGFGLEALINNALIFEIQEFAKKILPNDDPNGGILSLGSCTDNKIVDSYFDIINYAIDVNEVSAPSPLEILTFLEMRDKRFSDLKAEFSPYIWQFRCYCIAPPVHSYPHNLDKEGYSYLFPTSLDYKEGKFKKYFIEFNPYHEEEAKLILSDIDKLLERKTFKIFKYY